MKKAFKIFIICYFLFVGVVAHLHFITVDYESVCKYNYSKNYIYVQDSFGTYCIELIYENLTKENPKPFDWNNKEIKEMCETPKFFDFTRWDNGICDEEEVLG